MRYAQINESGLCFAESQLSGPIDEPTLIELAEGVHALGKRWDGAAWQEVEFKHESGEGPIMVITSMIVADDPSNVTRIAPDFTTLKMPVGATVTIDAELRHKGEVVTDFNEEFSLPLRSSDGARRYINVKFNNGLTTFSAVMSDSKRWEVSKELINSDLPAESHMDFAGVVITAVE